MNVLREKYDDDIQTILAKYPPDRKRSAVMPLLFIAQRDGMYVSQQDMDNIAEILGISSTDIASIVGFYTLYYEKPEGKYRIQVCTDLPCALRDADQFMAELCEKLDIEPRGTTKDGVVTVEPVMCLAACDRAPMFQLQSADGLFYHENQTVKNTLELVEVLRARD